MHITVIHYWRPCPNPPLLRVENRFFGRHASNSQLLTDPDEICCSTGYIADSAVQIPEVSNAGGARDKKRRFCRYILRTAYRKNVNCKPVVSPESVRSQGVPFEGHNPPDFKNLNEGTQTRKKNSSSRRNSFHPSRPM